MTLRIPNLIYFAAVGNLVYLLCRRVSKSNIITLIGILLCVTTPNVLTFPRTQYYIMLPGCVFFFGSLFLLCIEINRVEVFRPKVFLISRVLQGLAFYGYFSYLFFAPASIILIGICVKGTWMQKIKSEMIYIWGIIIGSIGYFAGYYDSFLTNLLGEIPLTNILLWSGILCMFFYLVVPVFLFWKHGNDFVSKKSMRIFITVSMIILFTACMAGGTMLF